MNNVIAILTKGATATSLSIFGKKIPVARIGKLHLK
jgi:hypothetical protein